MGTISRNFSYSEFEVTDVESQKESNKISSETIKRSVDALVDTVLQPLRDAWKAPLSINSGYRNPVLNQIVGGTATSQHTKGEAADVCPSRRRNDPSVSEDRVCALAKTAQRLNLPFDQMILYPTFVHFSHRLVGKQRGQILYSKKYNGDKL